MTDNYRLLTCPECGYTYPPGTVVTLEGVLDPIIESGGRSLHPSSCPRSENLDGGPPVGLFQQISSSKWWQT